MRKREADSLYNQWFPLVVHIIHKNFNWATQDTGTGAYRKIRRAVDTRDLYQEGWIALVDAKEHFDRQHESGASFKTYAYRVIYNHLLNYLDDNCTPITTARRRHILRYGSDRIKERLESATSYLCFSELSHRNIREGMDELEFVPVPPQENEGTINPAVRLENFEFQEHCIEKLKASLPAEDWRILMFRYDGMTLKNIGLTVGLSYERVRTKLEELNYTVRHILYEEIEEFGYDHDTDKSVGNQA